MISAAVSGFLLVSMVVFYCVCRREVNGRSKYGSLPPSHYLSLCLSVSRLSFLVSALSACPFLFSAFMHHLC